ncbi:MAG: MotA/TolQ/ExbB proton channel family protein [Candidatus Omnitrophica bacterium]|nr:MotA/TolQ/ExbB proton channel family protein [Candidatus Omnitrophota bacterium]
MLDIVAKGGWLMWPIIVCSIFSLAIIIERFFYFLTIQVPTSKLLEEIREFVKKGELKAAIDICSRKDTPVTNIIKAGLLSYDRRGEDIKEVFDEVALYEVPKLERHLNFLATIAHISPLLGLLGTVTGMIKCFYIIQTKSATLGAVNPADLAGGIWEALLTTAAGLAVAIPTLIAYNYFVSKVNFTALEMERSSRELLSIITDDRSNR